MDSPLPLLDVDWLSDYLDGVPQPATVASLVAEFKAGLLQIVNDPSRDMVDRHAALEWHIETTDSERAIAGRQGERVGRERLAYNVRVIPLLAPPQAANRYQMLQRIISQIEKAYFYLSDICRLTFSDSGTYIKRWPTQCRQILLTILQERTRLLLTTPGGKVKRVQYNIALPMKVTTGINCTYYSCHGRATTRPHGELSGYIEVSLSATEMADATIDLGVVLQYFKER